MPKLDDPEIEERLADAIQEENNGGFAVFKDTRDNFHPYECGKGCIHCNREETENHNPKICELCNF